MEFSGNETKKDKHTHKKSIFTHTQVCKECNYTTEAKADLISILTGLLCTRYKVVAGSRVVVHLEISVQH